MEDEGMEAREDAAAVSRWIRPYLGPLSHIEPPSRPHSDPPSTPNLPRLLLHPELPSRLLLRHICFGVHMTKYTRRIIHYKVTLYRGGGGTPISFGTGGRRYSTDSHIGLQRVAISCDRAGLQ